MIKWPWNKKKVEITNEFYMWAMSTGYVPFRLTEEEFVSFCRKHNVNPNKIPYWDNINQLSLMPGAQETTNENE